MHLRIPKYSCSHGEYPCEFGRILPVVESIGKNPEDERFYTSHGFSLVFSIGHCSWNGWDFGYHTAIVFTFYLYFHGIAYSSKELRSIDPVAVEEVAFYEEG